MMPQHANAFIGLRVPKPIKKAWTECAKQEHRSLSNWIIRQLEAIQAKTEPPRKSS